MHRKRHVICFLETVTYTLTLREILLNFQLIVRNMMGERKRDSETESDKENDSNNGMEWSVPRIEVTGKEVSETNRFRMQMLKYKIKIIIKMLLLFGKLFEVTVNSFQY